MSRSILTWSTLRLLPTPDPSSTRRPYFTSGSPGLGAAAWGGWHGTGAGSGTSGPEGAEPPSSPRSQSSSAVPHPSARSASRARSRPSWAPDWPAAFRQAERVAATAWIRPRRQEAWSSNWRMARWAARTELTAASSSGPAAPEQRPAALASAQSGGSRLRKDLRISSRALRLRGSLASTASSQRRAEASQRSGLENSSRIRAARSSSGSRPASRCPSASATKSS